MPITLERIPHDKQVAVYTMSALGLSVRQISKAVGISNPTICYINKQIPANLDEIEQYKKGLIARQYGIAMRSSNYITDDKLDKMNALQLMTISAIGIDKARDMEGSNRPVFNIINVAADLSKRLTEIKTKQQALFALREDSHTPV